MKRKSIDLLWCLLLIAPGVFLASTNIYAGQAPKVGISFVNSIPFNCFGVPGDCAQYNYSYTGTPTGLEVLIPKIVHTKFSSGSAALAGCTELITNGTGDPAANGFGVSIQTHNLCKVLLSNGTFFIRADPSSGDPISFQVQVSNKFTGLLVQGPAVPTQEPPAVVETGATLQTLDGTSVSYEVVDGQIFITEGTGRVVPINHTKLCVLNVGGDPAVPYTSPAFASNWTCETVTFATEQCDIKTAGHDPLRYSGGSGIIFP